MPKEREDKQFKSSSGICNIHAVIWYPDSDVYKKPVGVIQIAHGMTILKGLKRWQNTLQAKAL